MRERRRSRGELPALSVFHCLVECRTMLSKGSMLSCMATLGRYGCNLPPLSCRVSVESSTDLEAG